MVKNGESGADIRALLAKHWQVVASLGAVLATIGYVLLEFGEIRGRLKSIEDTRAEIRQEIKDSKEATEEAKRATEAASKVKGLKGDRGPQGESGPKGDPGSKGEQGQKGDPGDKGDKGAKGDIGPKGDTGGKGEKGDTGKPGRDGKNGAPGPIGCVVAWPVTQDPPDDWRVCKAQELDVRQYPKLAEVLGDTYGKVGPNKVKLPNFQGMFLRGSGGKADPLGVLQEESIQRHPHTVGARNDLNISWGTQARISVLELHGKPDNDTVPIESGGGDETRPVNYAVHWIIRVK